MAENKKWSEVGEISTPSGTTKICVIHEPEGSGDPSNRLIDVNNLNYTKLSGTNYVFARGNGTPSENAAELQAAYDLAKTMLPSSGNTVTVVVAPGTYTFGATKFSVNAAYISIVSLTGDADVLLDGINVTASNVYLKGLNCGTNAFRGESFVNCAIENCVGGNYSFGYSNSTHVSITNSIFTDCVGGSSSFGNTFYGDVSISGSTFTDCVGLYNSYGNSYSNTTISDSTFTDCVGGDYSFGYGYIDSTVSGTFTNCVGGNSSFGGYGGTASGTFTNCVSGNGSFGGGGGAISSTGRLYYCRLTSGTFPIPAIGGKIIACIDGNDDFIMIS